MLLAIAVHAGQIVHRDLAECMDHLAQTQRLALVVDEPEISAAIFEKDFGLPRQDFSCGSSNVPLISVGRSALALFQSEDPFLGPSAKNGVHHIAIAATDPEAAANASGIRTVNGPKKGVDGKDQVELASTFLKDHPAHNRVLTF